MSLPFARPQRQGTQGWFVNFQRYGHVRDDTRQLATGKSPAAVTGLGTSHEIARFKGLGEISVGEFKNFIGENIRLAPVNLHHLHSSGGLLSFFMGKNTMERQEFIIENLRVDKDLVETAA